ncbi:hypothetical protein GUJ93_ZPchr0001g32532 [Zizania palustris]|uniref:Vacuolar fusion protein MON1 homolog n=1 Tax=Zizania palustris TaxID=103762 RepID=A0A8J5RP44_ZIZPA|nr:hypothetical protein GUJ93_ZPchr0001g32532 [Zizania palustris]
MSTRMTLLLHGETEKKHFFILSNSEHHRLFLKSITVPWFQNRSRPDAFYDLKDSRSHIQNVLLKANVLVEVQKSLREGALHIEYLPADPSSLSLSPPPQLSEDVNSQLLSSETAIGGPAGLLHFIYKSIYLNQ